MKQLFNIGCGGYIMEGITNVDINSGEGVDVVCDLSIFPWPWDDNSIDGIYAIHFLEHFRDSIQLFRELNRVLKPGGFLMVAVPHSTSIYAMANLDHYTAWSLPTFKQVTNPSDLHLNFFHQDFIRIRYMLWDWRRKHPHLPQPKSLTFVGYPLFRTLFRPVELLIQFLIDLHPMVFERFWSGLVGGADEMWWRGIKKEER